MDNINVKFINEIPYYAIVYVALSCGYINEVNQFLEFP